MLSKPSTCRAFLSHARRSVGVHSQLRSVSFLSLEDDLDSWPRARKNTVINVCSEGILTHIMTSFTVEQNLCMQYFGFIFSFFF